MDKKRGYVYFASMAGKNYLKIGCSKHPHYRVSTLQTGNPYHLRILHKIAVSDKHLCESMLHILFQKERITHDGEWFDNTGNVAVFLKRVKKGDDFMEVMNDMLEDFPYKGSSFKTKYGNWRVMFGSS